MCKKGILIFRDYCKRIVRQICGDTEWVWIPRHQCSNESCKKLHRMLPDFLVPFKHYVETVITDCINDRLVAEEIDYSPSEQTIKRWKRWIKVNVSDIDGQLKSIGYRELGFAEELLKSGVSLLKELRRSIPEGWLRAILRTIYNAGAKLSPYYE